MLFDLTAPQQCKSSTVELVREKDRGNFCDEFRFRETESNRPPRTKKSPLLKQTGEEKLDPREKFRRLFNDSKE
ncbi:MAG TPA: hypothetical protein VM223_17920 [Planctomycetota bacterium]|nr:hypothetical protein [Planctomycetota bacterium]HUW33490.1 hypothetical protein [Planctomycetota bacterium]